MSPHGTGSTWSLRLISGYNRFSEAFPLCWLLFPCGKLYMPAFFSNPFLSPCNLCPGCIIFDCLSAISLLLLLNKAASLRSPLSTVMIFSLFSPQPQVSALFPPPQDDISGDSALLPPLRDSLEPFPELMSSRSPPPDLVFSPRIRAPSCCCANHGQTPSPPCFERAISRPDSPSFLESVSHPPLQKSKSQAPPQNCLPQFLLL